jgi:hypothetical protein
MGSCPLSKKDLLKESPRAPVDDGVNGYVGKCRSHLEIGQTEL